MFSTLAHLALLGFTAFASVPATALTTLPAPATQPTAVAAAPTVLYRLDAASNYVEGCQAPCLCPIWFNDDLFGTMAITFDHSAPNWYDYYRVTDVNWVLGYGANAQRITGRGTYRVGGQFAVQHQLVLDLSTDGGPPVRFDSGLVLGGGTFPSFDISVAMNGFFCYDRVFNVSASPVPAAEILPYRLRGSSHELGCQPPCKCLIMGFEADGKFALVDLGPASDPTQLQYALVDVSWTTKDFLGAAANTFRGSGIYSVDAVGIQHRLVCDLVDKSGARARFDSGIVPGGYALAPIIDIDIAVNGFYCFDSVFRIYAVEL